MIVNENLDDYSFVSNSLFQIQNSRKIKIKNRFFDVLNKSKSKFTKRDRETKRQRQSTQRDSSKFEYVKIINLIKNSTIQIFASQFFSNQYTIMSSISSQLYNMSMTQREMKFTRNFIAQSTTKENQKRKNHIDDDEKRKLNKRIKK